MPWPFCIGCCICICGCICECGGCCCASASIVGCIGEIGGGRFAICGSGNVDAGGCIACIPLCGDMVACSASACGDSGGGWTACTDGTDPCAYAIGAGLDAGGRRIGGGGGCVFGRSRITGAAIGGDICGALCIGGISLGKALPATVDGSSSSGSSS